MKKIIGTLILSSTFSLALSLSAKAETLHAYVFSASLDPQIGPTVGNDATLVKNNLQQISKSIGYTSNIKVFKDGDFLRSNIDRVLNNDIKNIGQNDVLVVYISSHGTNVSGNFPHIVENNEQLIGTEKYIHEKVKGSKARLKITVIDACNNVSNIDISREAKSKNIEIFKKNYKRLFENSKGDLLVSSSEKGKYSIAGPKYSIFTQQFLLALSTVAGSKDDSKISWKNVLDKASDFTFRESTIYHDVSEQVTPYRPVWLNNIQETKSTPVSNMSNSPFSLNSTAKRLSIPERKKNSTLETHQVIFNLNASSDVINNISKVVYFYAKPLDLAADGNNSSNTGTVTITTTSNNFAGTMFTSEPYIVWADIYMKNNDIQVLEGQNLSLESD